MFLALVKHLEEHQNTLRSSGKITTIVYHYILTGDEPAIPGHSNIYSAVKRPALRPVVTDLPGIRSAFCFREAGEKTLAYAIILCTVSCHVDAQNVLLVCGMNAKMRMQASGRESI